MKYRSLLVFALCCAALRAQTVNSSTGAAGSAGTGLSQSQASASSGSSTAAKAGQLTSSTAASSQVSAELSKKVDSKNAQAGDQVLARITSNATLADGTKLPKGTKLVGHVTDVHAKSSADKTSHLAFSMDRAVLHDGREVPVHTTLTSLSAPSAMASANGGGMDEFGTGGGMASAGATGGGRTSAGGGGGLVGGAARSAGGVAGSGAGLAGNTINSAGTTVNGLGSTAGSTLHSTAAAGLNGAGAVGGVAGSAAGGVQFDRVPVGNLPGVTFSSAANAAATGSLDATGRNISLENGTQLGLAISASH